MPLNAFIVRPFGTKELSVRRADVAEKLKSRAGGAVPGALVEGVEQVGGATQWNVKVNFDSVDQCLIRPALERLRILGETATAVVVAGNIREDMFNRLITADLVIADLSVHNPNVFYELGIRQAFRDKYTFLIRSDLSDYPFDLKTDRYFEYDLVELADSPLKTIKRLADALRATVSSYEADSPIFKLLPQLEAEDRARFIAVPDEFREEVERARRYRRREHLSLLAVECEGFLWEVEGLRVVGRAQFESNFIDGAKQTWEQIVGRYPDDVEANTVLSTIYQRLSDMTRSEQALARVSRTRSLSPNRLSELRSLSGRNLKEAWVKQWRVEGLSKDEWQRAALMSPLLQHACDAYAEAFKADLNNSYAGLNALTLLVIQAELAQKWPKDWRSIQRHPQDDGRELEARINRIRQLISALELAVESDRERLGLQGVTDPWFSLLDAAVSCIVSDQPEHVAQLYEEAKHFAPVNAEDSMRRALEVYLDLDIGGRDFDPKWEIGSIGSNVQRAIRVLTGTTRMRTPSKVPERIVLFVGLRLDSSTATADAPDDGSDKPANPASARYGFPHSCVDAARAAIAAALDEEIAHCSKVVLGLAAAANGGDLLFHEVCRERGIPTRMCLALPRPAYVGQYVAPAGKDWVERFSTAHRLVREGPADSDALTLTGASPITVFTDANELPRWLQGKPFYNVGRRNNLWMLQHAIMAAGELGDNVEVTLLALWNEGASEGGIGGIGDVIKLAGQQGIKVHTIPVPRPPVSHRGNGSEAAANEAPSALRPNGRRAPPAATAPAA